MFPWGKIQGKEGDAYWAYNPETLETYIPKRDAEAEAEAEAEGEGEGEGGRRLRKLRCSEDVGCTGWEGGLGVVGGRGLLLDADEGHGGDDGDDDYV